jgi:hypothetical protein
LDRRPKWRLTESTILVQSSPTFGANVGASLSHITLRHDDHAGRGRMATSPPLRAGPRGSPTRRGPQRARRGRWGRVPTSENGTLGSSSRPSPPSASVAAPRFSSRAWSRSKMRARSSDGGRVLRGGRGVRLRWAAQRYPPSNVPPWFRRVVLRVHLRLHLRVLGRLLVELVYCLGHPGAQGPGESAEWAPVPVQWQHAPVCGMPGGDDPAVEDVGARQCCHDEPVVPRKAYACDPASFARVVRSAGGIPTSPRTLSCSSGTWPRRFRLALS